MIGKKVRINPDIAEEDFNYGSNPFMLEWQEIGAIGIIEQVHKNGDLYVRFCDESDTIDSVCYLVENEVVFVDYAD